VKQRGYPKCSAGLHVVHTVTADRHSQARFPFARATWRRLPLSTFFGSFIYGGFSFFSFACEFGSEFDSSWTSRQADPARALVLFEDRPTGAALTAIGTPTSLVLHDGSAILEVLMLAQRSGVLLTP
jgi:hypothetical protein